MENNKTNYNLEQYITHFRITNISPFPIQLLFEIENKIEIDTDKDN